MADPTLPGILTQTSSGQEVYNKPAIDEFIEVLENKIEQAGDWTFAPLSDAGIISFTAVPNPSLNAGDPVVLTWTSRRGVTAILGDGTTDTEVALNGSTTVNPMTDTTYTLTVSSGIAGSTDAVETLLVEVE
jgi:hypothetical protein